MTQGNNMENGTSVSKIDMSDFKVKSALSELLARCELRGAAKGLLLCVTPAKQSFIDNTGDLNLEEMSLLLILLQAAVQDSLARQMAPQHAPPVNFQTTTLGGKP